MPEGQPEGNPKKRKGLLAFYVATGFLALLFVGFYFGWTPLRVSYWERGVLRKAPADGLVEQLKASSNIFTARSGSATPLVLEQIDGLPEALNLVDAGPRAGGALGRLLQASDREVRGVTSLALEMRKPPWVLPLVMQAVESKDVDIALNAVFTAQRLTDEDFGLDAASGSIEDRKLLPDARKRLLAWWEREGKAKYGSGK